MLEARDLTKRYGGFLAVDRVSFGVRRGEILGYLGPNGSGKSTTVNMVVGLLDSSGGSVALDGRTLVQDPVAYKRRIGYVPEEPHLYTQKVCSRVVILSNGRVVAEEDVRPALGDGGRSLEDVFVAATAQEDYSATARAILDVVRTT